MTVSTNFQDIILNLKRFWAEQGCIIWSPHHETVGAGTGNPATFLRVLGPEPWMVGYEEPSFRADDGRYAENPNRMQMHHQFQVILKPPPSDPTGLYLKSLEAVGFDLAKHDVRFVEDNWESPALGAWGLGWEVWLDGMEITQFTYFQQCGGLQLDIPSCEITYGLERLATYLQQVDSVWQLQWNDTVRYDQLLKAQEIEYCRYNFEYADTDSLRQQYDLFDREAQHLLEIGLPIPAYDLILRCSQTFNVLDARGAVGVAERVKLFGRMRSLCRKVAMAFVESREKAGFPLLKSFPFTDVSASPPLNPQQSVKEQRSFVFELGCEELTAQAAPVLAERFSGGVLALIKRERLQCSEPEFFVTPRRLGFILKELSPLQRGETERVFGPAKEICDKNPKALEGFCRRNGVSSQQVQFEEKDGKLCAVVERVLEAGEVTNVLGRALESLLSDLKYEKEMRWLPPSEGTRAFNRPVRWMLSLFGDTPIAMTAFGIHSGSNTCVGRWESSRELPIARAEDYVSTLSEHEILPFPNERREKMLTELRASAQSVGYEFHADAALVDEILFLVENPVVFVGRFEEEFSELPDCVLQSVIRKHVRCFPLVAKGEMANVFLGVSNGRRSAIESVKAGFERVVRARFLDAQFFITNDKLTSLDECMRRLETLTFHEKIGSYGDKARRIAGLANHFCSQLGLDDSQSRVLKRAFEISKFDLVTQMVTEMTSLAGKIGAIYAAHYGEDAAVCDALREQYLPAHRQDVIPETTAGRCLSVADKFDSLAALLSVGHEPTGSADPFAMRRDAHGVLANLIALPVDLNLSVLSSQLESHFSHEGGLQAEKLLEKVLSFFGRRAEIFFAEEGFEPDLVRAVLPLHIAAPRRASRILKELRTALATQELRGALAAYKRCHRIWLQASEKGETITAPRAGEYCAAFESLDEQLQRHVVELGEKRRTRGEDGILASLKDIQPFSALIEEWFDSVLVMADDPEVRARRLGMIDGVVGSLISVVRFEELEGDRILSA